MAIVLNPDTGQYEDDQSGGNAPPPTPTPTPTPAPGTGGMDPKLAKLMLAQAYWYYLGRVPDANEYATYAGPSQTRANLEKHLTTLQQSDEAQYYYLTHNGKWNEASFPGVDGAPATSAGTQGTSGTGSGDHSAFGQAWLASGGKTPADLKAFVEAHPEYGATIFGSKGDKVKIGGRSFDAIESAGTGGIRGLWNDITDGEAGGQAPTGANNYGQPNWDKIWSYPKFDETFTSNPWTKTFSHEDWTPTTEADMNADPGYKFRRDQGQQAILANKAMRGTLIGPDTWKAEERFGQDLASQEFGNVDARRYRDFVGDYGRDMGEYQIDYGQFRDNEADRRSDFATRYGMYGDQFNRDLTGFQTNYGQYTDAYSRARQGQNDLFGQNLSLSSLGLGATGSAQGGSDADFQSLLNAYLGFFGQNQQSGSDASNAYNSAAAYRSNNNQNALTGLANSIPWYLQYASSYGKGR